MRKHRLAATGGTFDVIHRGHMELLSAAFDAADEVIIGVTSDAFAARRGKSPENGYGGRAAALADMLAREFPGRQFQIARLESDFGPAVLGEGIGALVVSAETGGQGARLNGLRKGRGLPPVEVVTVPMVLAGDGARISTTRIKNSEIDADGNLLPVDN